MPSRLSHNFRIIGYCIAVSVLGLAISLWSIWHYASIRDAQTPALLTIPRDTTQLCLLQRGTYYGSGTVTTTITDGLSTSFSAQIPVAFGSSVTTVKLSGFILGNAFNQVVSTKFIANSPIAQLEATSSGVQTPAFLVSLNHPSVTFKREFSLSAPITIHATPGGFELRTKSSSAFPNAPLDLTLTFGDACAQATTSPLELSWIKKIAPK